jgi:hypothetical protein
VKLQEISTFGKFDVLLLMKATIASTSTLAETNKYLAWDRMGHRGETDYIPHNSGSAAVHTTRTGIVSQRHRLDGPL